MIVHFFFFKTASKNDRFWNCTGALLKSYLKKKTYTLAYTSYLRCHLCFLQPDNG